MIHSKILIPLAVAWAFLLAGIIFCLAKYDATPGVSAHREQLTLQAARPLSSAGLSLLMFVHPQCPCSAASIKELAELMSQCESRMHATVFFFQPTGLPPEWSHSDLWRAASAINGVDVRSDIDAKLARQLGAQTSGQVFLCDRTGKVLFEGGITGSRGHVGDNDSLSLLAALILESRPNKPPVTRLTYGCPIYSDADGLTAPLKVEAPQ